MNKFNILTKSVFLLSFALTPFSYSDNVDVSNTPLIVSSVVDPNVMLLIDSSGSMTHVVPESPYDATKTYVSCPSGMILDNVPESTNIRNDRNKVYVWIQPDGDVYFQQNGKDYNWGVISEAASVVKEGEPVVCFDPAKNYNAGLYADTEQNGDKKPQDYGSSLYSGNYLNWYFSNETNTKADNFGAGARVKSGVRRRLEIAREAGVKVVNSMENTRVGLATYNGEFGAEIKQGLVDIDTNRSLLESKINGVNANGYTPLAESFQDIGRYFLEGFESNQITLWPDDEGK